MQIGLIGLQNSGKTTLFNALSEKTSEAQHQQKSEVSRAVVKVPDIRLDKLTELFKPKSKVFATLEVIDIPGLQVS
ncbi:MAG: redox-regulated ATPase YchF, partial [Ignavibacteria bacterium]|nr:redox-regulated ATPase YchF [Ignavibacteria bacterium]